MGVERGRREFPNAFSNARYYLISNIYRLDRCLDLKNNGEVASAPTPHKKKKA